MAVLRWQDMGGVHFYELGAKERVVIGRAKDADISLNDTQASRHHAEVKRLPGAYVINDLSSKNGTMVNGMPISSWTLKQDDMITVGGTSLIFRPQR